MKKSRKSHPEIYKSYYFPECITRFDGLLTNKIKQFLNTNEQL